MSDRPSLFGTFVSVAREKDPLKLAIFLYSTIKEKYYEYEEYSSFTPSEQDFDAYVVEIATFVGSELSWSVDQIEKFMDYINELVPNEMITGEKI